MQGDEMKQCDKDCPAICDFCRMFNRNEKYIDGHFVYIVDDGYCVQHERSTNPTNTCDDFVCGGYKVKDANRKDGAK